MLVLNMKTLNMNAWTHISSKILNLGVDICKIMSIIGNVLERKQ